MALDVTATTRRPRGGREARRAGRAGHGAPAYITRRIPTYEMLSEEALLAVEDHADRILEEVGFESAATRRRSISSRPRAPRRTAFASARRAAWCAPSFSAPVRATSSSMRAIRPAR